MPPVSPIGNSPPVQPALGGGVGHHGTNAVVLDASAGQSFETALAQAVNARGALEVELGGKIEEVR